MIPILLTKEGGTPMIKTVIFDMFETLITHFDSPLYFGQEMALDAGIPEDIFLKLWRPSEYDRTIGILSTDHVLADILHKNNCYSDEILSRIIAKRIKSKEACFEHLHPEIIPMLDSLKNHKIQIGLISNCFSEEATVIHNSILYPYFDVPLLSYEEGLQKPDKELFYRCISMLNVSASECLYIGDGGSCELETATAVGMNAMQAVWYLKDEPRQPCKRKPEFIQIERPLDVMKYL